MRAEADPLLKPCAAFDGARLLAAGGLGEVALAVKRALEHAPERPILVFGDETGHVIDLDLRGGEADVLARLRPPPGPAPTGAPPSPGRPKLGVVAREVTLLPRHWEWLAGEPGGASAALRRLVEDASRTQGAKRRRRAAQEAAYRFMRAIAGDRAGFEEATRALFAGDGAGFKRRIARWPQDIRNHTLKLAFPADT